MFRNGSLQSKLIGAFLLMGAIVLVVALVGWLGNYRMNQYVTTLSKNTLPSIIGLWQINEGQTQIESAERWLLNPLLSEHYRREALQKIEAAKNQIDQGFKTYSNTPRTDEEEELYKQLLVKWKEWQNNQENFLNIEANFNKLGMRNPWQKEGELLIEQNPKNLAKMELAKKLYFYTKK
ncbi:MAG: hypothetical protein Fur0025_43850 [Oscillatoriaceae cyanobacterium]